MQRQSQPKRNAACVLLSSGGQDPTITALRLREQFERLVQVTVTTDYLVALEHFHPAEGLPELSGAFSGQPRKGRSPGSAAF